MKAQLAIAFFLLATSTVASADAQPAGTGLITCWYNDKGDYTGADSAADGVQPGPPVHNGSGDYAWGYTIQAADGSACPRKLPQ